MTCPYGSAPQNPGTDILVLEARKLGWHVQKRQKFLRIWSRLPTAHQLLAAQRKVHFVYLGVRTAALDEWSSGMEVHGAQCVTIPGIWPMQKLFAGSWAVAQP